MMKWTIVFIILYFGNEIASLNEAYSNKIIYTLCGCPFGYYEVSRFVLSSDTPPPNCTYKIPQRKSKRTLEGYQCHVCHTSCFGCHGSTDGDCNQCSNDHFRASSYTLQKINNSHALLGNGERITVYDSEMNTSRRDRRSVKEAKYPEYKLEESESIDKNKNSSDDLFKEFVRDVNEDNLLILDAKKQEKSSADGVVGESDFGSGYAEKELETNSTIVKGSFTTENFQLDTVSTPREIRSTETVLSNNESVPVPIDIYEKVIFTPASVPPTTNVPIVKHSTVIKRITTAKTTSTTTQSTTLIITTTQSITSTLPTTRLTTTPKSITTTTQKTRKPKLKKITKIPIPTVHQSPTEEHEYSQMQATFWCVATCPDGSYADQEQRTCLPCDSKCSKCVGPSFMNCTECTSNSVRVSAKRGSSRAMKNLRTITCLSNCPPNEFDNNGTCTLCHDYCVGCTEESVKSCLTCKYSRNEEENECIGPKSDPLSVLEIILPIVFIIVPILFTIAICLRWNGFLRLKKFNKMSFNYLSACRSPATKIKPNSDPLGLNKEFILRKQANEYTTNPQFPKICNAITEDGYELPMQPQPGPSGFGSRDLSSNSSTMRSIKPRRNDPLPPTPLEMRAALHRKNSYLYDHYVNQPNPEIEQIEKSSISMSNGNVQNTRHNNTERIYANC